MPSTANRTQGRHIRRTPTNRGTGRLRGLVTPVADHAPGAASATTEYCDVDVAIVMESTYPYLKGGVSAVVHDIVTESPHVTFGIIHITWDTAAPHEDLYGMPENVKWVKPVYLSLEEHRDTFMKARPSDLKMTSQQRAALSHRLFDALYSLSERREVAPLWELIDEGMLESTRTYPLWALLGSREFMAVLEQRMPQLGMSLSDSFWLLRNFFSLAYAILHETMPRAKVYHAHTTGYAAVVGAAAAREHDTSFLLTEHNLYIRDTVNTLLERNMALPLTSEDYRTFDVSAEQRAWMAWWTEMGHFCYPSAQLITYLYPSAITEAAELGTDLDKSLVVPNGMVIAEFEEKYRARLEQTEKIIAMGPDYVWHLAYIARVVPIKGLLDLLDSLAMLRDRGVTNVHLDVMGPTEHTPEYYDACVAKIERLALSDMVTIHGTVQVRSLLHTMDLLVMPSYNEGQPIVALEAMSAAIPTVSTRVGGMGQLVEDELTTVKGSTLGPAGILLDAGDAVAMADGIEKMVADPELYAQMGRNARSRVEAFFQMHDVMASYNGIYKMLEVLTALRSQSVRDLTGASGPAPAVVMLETDTTIDLRPAQREQIRRDAASV